YRLLTRMYLLPPGCLTTHKSSRAGSSSDDLFVETISARSAARRSATVCLWAASLPERLFFLFRLGATSLSGRNSLTRPAPSYSGFWPSKDVSISDIGWR